MSPRPVVPLVLLLSLVATPIAVADGPFGGEEPTGTEPLTGKAVWVSLSFWSGPPTSDMPVGADCDGEFLGIVAVYWGPGRGYLPGPLNIPLLTGVYGLSPVTFLPPDPDRIGDIQCLRVGVAIGLPGQGTNEVAHAAMAPPVDVPPLPPLP